MKHSVTLLWPPAALRPNASSPGNWRRKSDAAKRYRRDCLILARAVKLTRPAGANLRLNIEFSPPDNRRRDLDNMLASFKVGIDAVAEVMGVDDSLFALNISRTDPVKDGRVSVRVEAFD